MKSALNYLRNLFCYCGIEKDEYNAIKKDAYVSNFKVWRILHILMAAVFAFLYDASRRIQQPDLFSESDLLGRRFRLLLYRQARFAYPAVYHLSVDIAAVCVRLFNHSEQTRRSRYDVYRVFACFADVYD